MHSPELLLMAGWAVSALMSTMPPVPENAPWFVRWAHDFGQVVGANINRVGKRSENPTPPVTPAKP